MRLFLLILVSFGFFGCNQLKKTQRYLFEHPDFSAEYCAEQYPPKDSVVVKYDTVLDVMTWYDTVMMQDFDTVTNTKIKTVYKTITKTITKDSIIYRINTAELERLRSLLQDCQKNANVAIERNGDLEKQVELWEGKAKTRFWWILLLIGGGVVYAGFKVKKILT